MQGFINWEVISVEAVGIAIAFFLLLFAFVAGRATVCKADTVSDNSMEATCVNNDVEAKETLPDNQTDDKADFSDDTDNNEVGINENISSDTTETGQNLYMDTELADSVLMYLNYSYKIQFVTAVLLLLLLGAVTALLIVMWFMR